ncbi:hypothetical protein PF327_11215 [Sulfurovum sp. XTW-4]|uniref:Uncharacterized protein n=1 Tax=Sulfurovum xiamenensis TaxID=3019066 RepID=A0ABT7QUX4_9BACT|nr:hypothetical protein [Sulfurovum xiamenensis]MDM5264764.1 hypothetical protein [Sulfurovum xiamenensis]
MRGYKMNKIIFILVSLTVSLFGSRNSCQMFLDNYSMARQKAVLHIETDSSKFSILMELNMAKNSLISAIAECKPYRNELRYDEMKPDLKKMSELIKQIEKW